MENAISQPRMVRLPRNKKQTYWLNSRPQVWPSVSWLCPWPWAFKVKYEICYVSVKNDPIATKRKANILNSRPQMLPLGLTLDMTFKGEVTERISDVSVPSTHLVWRPIDFSFVYPIFKWVAITWQGWEGTRIVVPTKATRWHDLLHVLGKWRHCITMFFRCHF